MNAIIRKAIVLLVVLCFVSSNTVYGLDNQSALRAISAAGSVVPANLVEDLHKVSSSGVAITAEDVLEKGLTFEDVIDSQTLEQTARYLLELPNESDRAYFGALYRHYKLQLMVDRQADALLESNPLLNKEEAMNQARALVVSGLRKSKREGDAIILEDAKPLIIGQNFSPSAMLSDRDFSERLGAVQYEDLEKDPENIKFAARVTMVQNPMNGGIGQAMDRIDFLKAVWHMTGRKGSPQLGAKSMDCYFPVKVLIDSQEKEAFVSVAEATILALLHEIEKEDGSYKHGILEQLISEETRQAMADLMDTVYLYDRLDAKIKNKRTYGEILKEKGFLGAMPEQAVFPRFSVEDNYKLTDKYTAPGSHGHWGVYVFSNIPDKELPEDGSIQIRAIFNGDGISNAPNNVIAGWMARENVPVVMITTTRSDIDVKGGMLGIENLDGGLYRTNLLEVADAKTNDKKHPGQAKLFSKMGISPAGKEFGRHGWQLFNTNTVVTNDTVLKPFLRELREVLGIEEYNRIISPKMMMKSAVQKDGKEYVQLEGPLGSSVLSLAGFLSTTDNPVVKLLCAKHNIDPKKFLRKVNIGVDKRTDFFAPIKFPIDYWLQFFSDHFKVDITTWKLINLRPGHVPALDTPDQDKDKYYSNVLNLFHLFGDNGVIDKDNPVMTSTIGLDYMKIRGKVKVAGSILRGRVVAINESDGLIDLTSGVAKDRLISENMVSISEDGRLILEDVLIVVDRNKEIMAAKLKQDDDIDTIDRKLECYKTSSAGSFLRVKISMLKLYYGDTESATEELVKIGYPAVPALVNALDSGSIKIRKAAGSALYRIGDPAIHYLKNVFANRTGVHTLHVAEILAKLDDTYIPALVYLAGHNGESVSQQDAILRLTEIKQIVIPYLEESAYSSYDAEACKALYLLGEIGDFSVTDIIVKVLVSRIDDKNESIRISAAQALGKIGDPSAIPALINGLEPRSYWSGFDKTAEFCMKALVSIGEPSIPYLIQALGARDNRIGYFAAQALSRINNFLPTDKLINALNDITHFNTRLIIERILVDLKDSSVVPILMHEITRLIYEVYAVKDIYEKAASIETIVEYLCKLGITDKEKQKVVSLLSINIDSLLSVTRIPRENEIYIVETEPYWNGDHYGGEIEVSRTGTGTYEPNPHYIAIRDSLLKIRDLRNRFMEDDQYVTSRFKLVDIIKQLDIDKPEFTRENLLKIAQAQNLAGVLIQLDEQGLLAKLIPPLAALKGIKQGNVNIPERDAFEHTIGVVENIPDTASIELKIAAIFHDIGKIETQRIAPDGKVTFDNHDIASGKDIKPILEYLGFDEDVVDNISWICANHMFKARLERGQLTNQQAESIIKDKRFPLVVMLTKADIISAFHNNQEKLRQILKGYDDFVLRMSEMRSQLLKASQPKADSSVALQERVLADYNIPIAPNNVYANSQLVSTLIAGKERSARTNPQLPIQAEKNLYSAGSTMQLSLVNQQAVLYVSDGMCEVQTLGRSFILNRGDIITVFNKADVKFYEDSNIVIMRQTHASKTSVNLKEDIVVPETVVDMPQIIRDAIGNLIASIHRHNAILPNRMYMITPKSAAIGIGVKIANGIEDPHRHEKDAKGKIEALICRAGSFIAQTADKYGIDPKEIKAGQGDVVLMYADSSHGFNFNNASLVVIIEDPGTGPDKVAVQLKTSLIRTQATTKTSSSGTTLDELLGTQLSQKEAVDFVINYSYAPQGIEQIPQEHIGNIVYSDSLQQSEALQYHIKQAQITGRKFFLINKEGQDLSFLKELGIDRSSFIHILHQNSNSAEDIAKIVAATLINHNIRQVRVFANTEADLLAWSKQGLIEALVLLLTDKRFEIISDYSQQHMDYIRTHQQALIAA
jgi:HEAT repeat protein